MRAAQCCAGSILWAWSSCLSVKASCFSPIRIGRYPPPVPTRSVPRTTLQPLSVVVVHVRTRVSPRDLALAAELLRSCGWRGTELLPWCTAISADTDHISYAFRYRRTCGSPRCVRRSSVAVPGRMSLAFQFVAPGDCFEFDPDCVHDRDDGAHLEFKLRERRAKLVNRQRIVAVHQHMPTPTRPHGLRRTRS